MSLRRNKLRYTFAPIYAIEPRWSPDGKQIVFSGLPSKLFLVPANGGVPQQLMPEDKPDVVGSATWSPDGNAIVFVRISGKEKAGGVTVVTPIILRNAGPNLGGFAPSNRSAKTLSSIAPLLHCARIPTHEHRKHRGTTEVRAGSTRQGN